MGLYAKFDLAVTAKEDVRCLALTYQLSQLMACQIFIVSDRDQRVAEEQTLSFEDIGTEKFAKIFSMEASDVEIDSNAEAEYQRKMLSYGILYTNLQAAALVQPKEAKTQMSLPDSQKLPFNFLEKRSQAESNQNASHQGIEQEIQVFIKKRI